MNRHAQHIHYRLKISFLLAVLFQIRTDMPKNRAVLSKNRTDMSENRTDISKNRANMGWNYWLFFSLQPQFLQNSITLNINPI